MTEQHEFDMEEMEPEIIYIQDEETDEEIAFEVIMRFEVDSNGKTYVMLLPYDDEDADEVVAFREEEDEDGVLQLSPIEDPEEWAIVEQTFNTLIATEDDSK